jgi:acyl carrier protein
MNEEQLEILTEVFRTLFNNPELTLDDGLVATDVPGWDSFNHINLIINIEEEFEVKFTNDEVAKMQNVGDLKKILATKIAT